MFLFWKIQLLGLKRKHAKNFSESKNCKRLKSGGGYG